MNIIILDDASGTPVFNNEFLNKIICQLRLEGFFIKLIRNDLSLGVCKARNWLIEEDNTNSDYILRVDDDVILEPDYVLRLIHVIEKGYDLATGTTPPIGVPKLVEKSRNALQINKVSFDDDGNVSMTDDCGYFFELDKDDHKLVVEIDHFRSCCLYKRSLNIKYPTNLSFVGFREESFVSLKMKWDGKRIGCDTSAIAWHLHTSSGGCRRPDYSQLVQSDDLCFKDWAKEKYKEKGWK